MKWLARLYRVIEIALHRLSGAVRCRVLKSEIERYGGHVGNGLLVQRGASISFGRGAKIRIGSRVILAEYAQIYVAPGAELEIGDGVFIGRGSVVAASEHVRLGDDSQIAHYVTVIDSDHRFDRSSHPLVQSGHKTSPIDVGKNVWIGASAVLLKGVSIGDGAVIGAGTVVAKPVPGRSVAKGNPATFRSIDG